MTYPTVTGGGAGHLISAYTPPSEYLDPPYIGPGDGTPTGPGVLQQTAPKPQSLAVTAEGALINLLYGPVPAKPKIFAVGTIGQFLVLGLLWGKGECDGFDNVFANKTALTGSQVHNYTGTQSQTADSWLVSGIPGYADALLGICYSVVKVSQEVFNNWPVFTANIRGRKVFDPRTSLTVYSTNPALFFRDLAILGGFTPIDSTIEAAADECDAIVPGGTGKRREAGVIFNSPNSLDNLLDTLAKYAGALYVRDAGQVKLVPNRPSSVVASFTDDETDGTKLKIMKDTLVIKKVSRANQPNRVVTQYTDTTRVPWGRAFAVAPLTPPSDPRTTRLAMSGVQTYAQARRESIEQLNYYSLTDLEAVFVAFDEALELEPGDVFDIDSAEGLVAKQFRCTRANKADDIGHWAIAGREYQPPGQWCEPSK